LAVDVPARSGAEVDVCVHEIQKPLRRRRLDEEIRARMEQEEEVGGEGPLVRVSSRLSPGGEPVETFGRRSIAVQKVEEALGELPRIDPGSVEKREVALLGNAQVEEIRVPSQLEEAGAELLVIALFEEVAQRRLTQASARLLRRFPLVVDLILSESRMGEAVPVVVIGPHDCEESGQREV
jgi:hypothetical protein